MIDVVFIRPPRVTDAYVCIAFLTTIATGRVHVLAKDHEIQTVLTNCDINHQIHFLNQSQNVARVLNDIVKGASANWILFCDPDQLNNGLDPHLLKETVLNCKKTVLIPENYTHIRPRYTGFAIENIPPLPFVFGINLKNSEKPVALFDGAFTTIEWTFYDYYYRFYPSSFLYAASASIWAEPWLSGQHKTLYQQRDVQNGILFCWKHLPFMYWVMFHFWCLVASVFFFRLKNLRALIKAVVRIPYIRFFDRKAVYFRSCLKNEEILL